MTDTVASRGGTGAGPATLTTGTLLASAVAVAVAQIGLSVPAVLNGMIQLDLGTTSTQLTWVSDAFLVPITLFELTFGLMGDLFGRKRLLAIGAGLMVLGAAMAGLTPTGGSHGVQLTLLFGGQAVSGIGAAAIFPTSIAMLAAGTRTVAARSHAISIWAAALTGAGVLGPVIGGLLARVEHGGGEEASWRWVFLALAALALLSTVLTLLVAQDSSAPQGRSLDWRGQVTVALGLFGLLYGVIQGAEDGWTDPVVLLAFAVGVVGLAAFVVVEQRVDKPLIQLSLFSNRIFAATAVVTVIGMFAYLGTAYATSIRVSAIQGYSPLKTAIAFVCLNVMGVVLFPVSTRLLERFNPGWTLTAGMVMIGAGDLVIAAIPATNLSIAAVAVPLLVIGAGFKLAVTSITVVAVNSVPTSKAGMASGATSMLRDLGLTLGPAIIGSIALTRASSEVAAKLAASPKLQEQLDAFNELPSKVPPGEKEEVAGAVHAVASGPLGANGVPSQVPGPDGAMMPFNPLKDVAFHALSNAYSVGYVVCGCAALVAALVAAVTLGGRSYETSEDLEGSAAG